MVRSSGALRARYCRSSRSCAASTPNVQPSSDRSPFSSSWFVQATKSLLQTVSFCPWRLRRLTRCWNVGRLPRCVAQPRIEGVRIQYDVLPRILQIALLSELVHVLRYDFPCRANILGEQFVSQGEHPH